VADPAHDAPLTTKHTAAEQVSHSAREKIGIVEHPIIFDIGARCNHKSSCMPPVASERP
jgi:hypothetical protein